MAKKNKEVQAEVTPVVAVDIIRGRMLLPIVYLIKFKEEGTDAELAARYRTTGGKVSDIKGNRNFGYIKAESRFSADDINEAVQFAEQLGEAAEAHVKGLLADLVSGGEADAEAIKAGRLAARKTKAKVAPALVEEQEDPEEQEEQERED